MIVTLFFSHKMSNPVVSLKVAKELAKTHNFTTGKWLISVPWDEVDNFWNLLKHAFIKDRLNEQARYIKVKAE